MLGAQGGRAVAARPDLVCHAATVAGSLGWGMLRLAWPEPEPGEPFRDMSYDAAMHAVWDATRWLLLSELGRAPSPLLPPPPLHTKTKPPRRACGACSA